MWCVCVGFYLFGAAVLRVCVCQVCSVCSAALLCAGSWGSLGGCWRLAVFTPRACAADVEGCEMAGLSLPWWRVSRFSVGVSPSLAWRAARRGRVCREGVCFTPAGCFLVLWSVVCCGGLLGAAVVVFVVLCCLAWAVGVFDVPLWVPPLVGTVGYI